MSVAAPEHGTTVPAGDPQALRAAAGRLTAAAAMDSVAANLGAAAEAACGGRSWVGPASLAFRRHVQETRQALHTGSRAFHDAAAALTRLAGELQAAQEEAPRPGRRGRGSPRGGHRRRHRAPLAGRAGACETTAEWLRRQAGDVFLDSPASGWGHARCPISPSEPAASGRPRAPASPEPSWPTAPRAWTSGCRTRADRT
jgi:hypothetical protein